MSVRLVQASFQNQFAYSQMNFIFCKMIVSIIHIFSILVFDKNANSICSESVVKIFEKCLKITFKID